MTAGSANRKLPPGAGPEALAAIRARIAQSVEMTHHLPDIAQDTDMAALLERFADEQTALLRDIENSLSDFSGPQAPPTPAEGADAPAQRKLRIVALEPVATTRRVLQFLITRPGHDFVGVDSLEAATQALETPSDLVLVALNNLCEPPAETVARLREACGAADAEIVGLAEDARPDLAASFDLDDILQTPVNLDALAAHLARLSRVAEEAGSPSASEPAPSFNIAALRDLETLGGVEFARDIAKQFLDDAIGLLDNIRTAAEACDEAAFRDQAHALRSCAANVGARSIYEHCLAWRDLDAATLAQQGRDCADTLELEYRAVAERIGGYARGEAELGE